MSNVKIQEESGGRRDLAEAIEEDGRRKCPHFNPPVWLRFYYATRVIYSRRSFATYKSIFT